MPDNIPTPSVPVVVATQGHLTSKSLYQFVRGCGAFLLALNLWLIANPDLVHFVSAKYIWVGPLLSALGSWAESRQTNAQKAKTQDVNNTLPATDADGLLAAALTAPVKE